MVKRKSLSPFPFIKKSSIASLITLLIYVLFKTAEPIIDPAPPPSPIPAAESPIQLYSNQTNDDLTHLYVNAINGAQQSVNLVIYALMDPQIIEALKQKSGSGIPVYIVCDAKASPGISRKLPQAYIIRRAGKGLTHQKILVIDDKQIWIGSANFTTDSLRVHGNLVIGLNNPGLAQALVDKIKSMDEENGSKPLLHRTTLAGPQNIELWVLPDDQSAAKRVIHLSQSAKKTIKVAMFTWTRTDFAQALIEAAKRGVKVEVVLDRYSGCGASAKIVEMLSQAGISVHLSTCQGLLHHKFAYIDDHILINGSANWTSSAFKVNDDVFLVVSPLTLDQQAKMRNLWKVILKESEKASEKPAKTKTKKKNL